MTDEEEFINLVEELYDYKEYYKQFMCGVINIG